MADETVVPIDDNAVKHYRREGSLLNGVQLKRRRIMYCESYQTYQFRTLGGSNTFIGIFIQESRMRENFMYGLTRGARETGYDNHCALVLLYNVKCRFMSN